MGRRRKRVSRFPNGGATVEIEFTGLPPEPGNTEAEVLFEEPRKIQATAGRFKDWFAPYEVHVYRFPKR